MNILVVIGIVIAIIVVAVAFGWVFANCFDAMDDMS